MRAILAFALFVLAATAASVAAEPCAVVQTILNGSSASSISNQTRVQSADSAGLASTLISLQADETSARAELSTAVATGDQNLASIEREVIAGLDRSIAQAKASSTESTHALQSAMQTQQLVANQAAAHGCVGGSAVSTTTPRSTTSSSTSANGSANGDYAGQWVIKTIAQIWGQPQLTYHNAQLVGPSSGRWTVDETMVATTSKEFQSGIGQHDTQCLVSLHPGGGLDFSCPSTHGWTSCALSPQSDGSFAGTCTNGSKIELRRGTYSSQ